MRPGHYGWDARIYRIWVGMKNRCQNPNNYSYHNYGGRGIKVCPEWQDYQTFLDWSLAHGYADGLSIDRIDNEGDYCPENCRWATRREQNCNTRQNHFLTYKGKTQTISQWAEDVGLDYSALKQRINSGWPVEKALITPTGGLNIHQRPSRAKLYTFNGETHTLREWADKLGVRVGTLQQRLYFYHYSIDDLLGKKVHTPVLITHNGKTQNASAWSREIGLDLSYICKQIKRGRTLEDIVATHQRRINKTVISPIDE